MTKNSKYRIENDVCTAVRDNASDTWRYDHPAVGERLVGAVDTQATGFLYAPTPTIGMRLVFSNDLMTTPLVSVFSLSMAG